MNFKNKRFKIFFKKNYFKSCHLKLLKFIEAFFMKRKQAIIYFYNKIFIKLHIGKYTFKANLSFCE